MTVLIKWPEAVRVATPGQRLSDDENVEWIALGHGHAYMETHHEGEFWGIVEGHFKPDGSWCEGYVPIVGPGELWTLESENPLTLSPSLQCRICPSHGFIRDGKWVPA